MRPPGSSAAVTRKRVERAALELFARRGFAPVGLREIASEVGVTPAALYHYMGQKEDLLVDIMRSTIVPLHEVAAATLAELAEPERKLAALVELHVWVHGAHSLATLVTDTELRSLDGKRRKEVVQLRDSYQELWRETVGGGVEAKRFQIEDVRLAAIGLVELCTGVSHWYKPSGERPLDELCALHAEWALRMVDARRGNRPIRRSQLELPSPAEQFKLHGANGDLPR